MVAGCALFCFLAAPDRVLAQAPTAPAIDSVVVGDGSLTITWTAPAGVSGIGAYDLRYIETSGDETMDANWSEVEEVWTSGDLTYTLDGLDNGVGYDLQMRAVTTTDGMWSATSSGTPQMPPDVPEAVTVYSYGTGKLEVRWSSSDYAATTGFGVQWKSGTDGYDSTNRQDLADPTTSGVLASSSATSWRYKHTITGLTDGTEYTVRVIATNAGVDSSPSPEATGTPQSTPGQPKAFIENEVIKIHESDFPWLRQTWDYVIAQNVEVEFQAQVDSTVLISCNPFPELDPCTASAVSIGRGSPALITDITHELGHVYSLSNNVTTMPGSLGIAHVYFWKLGLQGDDCTHVELYADILMFLVHGDHARDLDGYWYRCVGANDKLTDEALAVVRSAVAGEMPSWLAATYSHAGGGLDLEGLWADVKTLRRPAVVY